MNDTCVDDDYCVFGLQCATAGTVFDRRLNVLGAITGCAMVVTVVRYFLSSTTLEEEHTPRWRRLVTDGVAVGTVILIVVFGILLGYRLQPSDTASVTGEPKLVATAVVVIFVTTHLLFEGLRRYRRAGWLNSPPELLRATLTALGLSWPVLLLAYVVVVSLGVRVNGDDVSYKSTGCFVQGAPVIIFLYAHRSRGTNMRK